MALLTFGSVEIRRAQVAAMRLAATALETRPLAGSEAELVRTFAGLMGCAGCHGFAESLDFSDLVGDTAPWTDATEGIAEIASLLPDHADRIEAVHASQMVAMFADEPDIEALEAAKALARGLGCDDTLIAQILAVADSNAAGAKADLFRRFLAERVDVDSEIIGAHMDRHDLAAITRPETIERYHRLIASAPEGSLGAEMRKFYDENAFDIPGVPGVPLPVEFLGSHDVHHVLASYGTSAQGEAYTAVFNAGNSSAGIGWLTVVLLQWHQGIKLGVFPEGHSHLDPAVVADAAYRGSLTATDLYDAHWEWIDLLNEPLDEVRASLGIPPGGEVLSGGCWGPDQI